MKQTTMMTLAAVFIMGMAVMPGLALTADTGMKASGSSMMKEESTMPGSTGEEKAEVMKKEMAPTMPEPMAGEMGKKMDSGEMHQQPTGEMNKEMEGGEESGKKMMQ
ncbi:MAG: hypothetical protein IH612_02465 [Desulfofustis sp.]|nr:hypothetical protein [Desulfofustis sp.]